MRIKKSNPLYQFAFGAKLERYQPKKISWCGLVKAVVWCEGTRILLAILVMIAVACGYVHWWYHHPMRGTVLVCLAADHLFVEWLKNEGVENPKTPVNMLLMLIVAIGTWIRRATEIICPEHEVVEDRNNV